MRSVSNDREFDEADFAKHVANVVQDAADHTVTVDEAIEAILDHPSAKIALHMKLVGPLDPGPRQPSRGDEHGS